MINYYEVLEVPFYADNDDIKRAFRRLAKKYHPDVLTETDHNSSRMTEIIEAYKILTDHSLRKKYDAEFVREAAEKIRSKYKILPKTRIIYTSTLKNIISNGILTRRNLKHRIKKLKFDEDMTIYISREEQKDGAVIKLTLPARTLCDVCFGGSRTCYRCDGIGRVVSTEELEFFIPPDVKDGMLFHIEPSKHRPRKFTYFTMKNLRIKIKVVSHDILSKLR